MYSIQNSCKSLSILPLPNITRPTNTFSIYTITIPFQIALYTVTFLTAVSTEGIM